MIKRLYGWFQGLNHPSYVILFVTARCNARCKMCFYMERIKNPKDDPELTIDEYEKISSKIKSISTLGISGGEPFLREDLKEIVKTFYKNCSPLAIDLPTNGFYTQRILEQVEDILKYCKDTVVDIQISIDGPEKIHNEIRGLKDSFRKMKETYKGLVTLKDRYKNLRLKACVVYSSYNQEYMEELFDILKKDFSELDRIVFSVVHGTASNEDAYSFSWDKYFKMCDNIRKTVVVNSVKDFHSIFTVALRIAKNEFLKEILRTKDVYKQCGAGRKVVAISEVGEVFPCEPLWNSVGNLRDNDYDLVKVLNSNEMKEFHKYITKNKCTCHWGLALSNALIYKLSYYPMILSEMLKIIARSISRKRGKSCFKESNSYHENIILR